MFGTYRKEDADGSTQTIKVKPTRNGQAAYVEVFFNDMLVSGPLLHGPEVVRTLSEDFVMVGYRLVEDDTETERNPTG